MPTEGGSGAPSKPTTRSSIRHSLGKALADVMNKDGRDSDKAAKKGAKDTHSRRLSGVEKKPAAPRASIGDVNRPPSIASRRTVTPDSKTITRRRVSVAVARASLDEPAAAAAPEQAPKPVDSKAEATPQGATIVRSASLRPRPGTSALPKYRPKSMIVGESATAVAPKPPSPVRAGVLRRLSTSEEEKEEEAAQQGKVESAVEKSLRPISPLPHRAALKVNLTSAINAPGSSVISVKTKAAPSSSSKAKDKDTPARPTKTVKTAATNSSVPRSSSSASSSSSFTPHTPKSGTGKAVSGVRRADKTHSNHGSPLRDSPLQRHTESPLARHSKNASLLGTPSAEVNEVCNMSHISEGNSEDSETEHVELLLAPVAALAAPTPAMPRTVTSRNRSRKAPPQTPTRSQLPTRANLSYLSPLPPDSDSPPSLRPQPAGNGPTVGRGSILSWEQLANEASRTFGEDEITKMLSEMPAPFRAGAISPSSHLEIPESPCLSALNSPGEYGSISQVLLPDVTPSPAVHANTSRFNDKDVPPVEAAVVTLLRLQLASAESIAKDRLFQMQSMEEEIHNLKQARLQDAEQLRRQVADLEHEVRGSLGVRQRADEDRMAHITSLEDALRQADAARDQAIDDAVAQTRASGQVEADAALRTQEAKTCALWCARVAGTQWAFVRDFAESDLDAIKGEREVLAALLADLHEVQRAMVFICIIVYDTEHPVETARIAATMPAPSATALAATPKDGAALGALLDGAGTLTDGAGALLLGAGALMALLSAGGVLDATGADAPGDVTLALGAGLEADAEEPGLVPAVEMVETMERGKELRRT
ncbi:hypothetical protein GGX14DRAFT_642074 [Mycena pura]|uniref:Uncharacterized protein n=1 Tax=Mycena pura TaxID=153505 RepID=A0AAD6YQ40_9AGAR|nr:hypothetical protein GGX14DRAFT_642074 [Mycena pura]